MTDTNRPGFFGSLRFKYGLGLLIFLAIAGFFLWEEHEAHIVGYLPLILLVGLCGGMHFFMHGSHGGDRGLHRDQSGEDER